MVPQSYTSKCILSTRVTKNLLSYKRWHQRIFLVFCCMFTFLCCYCCLIALYNLLARACEITEHTQARLVIKAENTGEQRREHTATLDSKVYFPQGHHLHKDVYCLWIELLGFVQWILVWRTSRWVSPAVYFMSLWLPSHAKVSNLQNSVKVSHKQILLASKAGDFQVLNSPSQIIS